MLLRRVTGFALSLGVFAASFAVPQASANERDAAAAVSISIGAPPGAGWTCGRSMSSFPTVLGETSDPPAFPAVCTNAEGVLAYGFVRDMSDSAKAVTADFLASGDGYGGGNVDSLDVSTVTLPNGNEAALTSVTARADGRSPMAQGNVPTIGEHFSIPLYYRDAGGKAHQVVAGVRIRASLPSNQADREKRMTALRSLARNWAGSVNPAASVTKIGASDYERAPQNPGPPTTTGGSPQPVTGTLECSVGPKAAGVKNAITVRCTGGPAASLTGSRITIVFKKNDGTSFQQSYDGATFTGTYEPFSDGVYETSFRLEAAGISNAPERKGTLTMAAGIPSWANLSYADNPKGSGGTPSPADEDAPPPPADEDPPPFTWLSAECIRLAEVTVTGMSLDAVACVVDRTIIFLLQFTGLGSTGLVIIGGFRLVTAPNDEARKQGKSIIKYALVGLVIILGSYIIVQFIFSGEIFYQTG